MSALYPVYLDLQGKCCVVVGGGLVGERKVRGLLDAQAQVVVIAPEITDGLGAWVAQKQIVWQNRPFVSDDLTGCFLVIAATNNAQVNGSVVALAQEKGILCCGADADSRGDFVVPAVVRRGDLQLAISTDGASPAYAKMVREDLEQLFGEEHALYLDFLKKLRMRVMTQFPNHPDKRKKVWQVLVNRDVLALVRTGQWDQIEERVSACLSLS